MTGFSAPTARWRSSSAPSTCGSPRQAPTGGERGNVLSAAVTDVVYQGAFRRVLVRFDGGGAGQVRDTAVADRSVAVGERVEVRVPILIMNASGRSSGSPRLWPGLGRRDEPAVVFSVKARGACRPVDRVGELAQ